MKHIFKYCPECMSNYTDSWILSGPNDVSYIEYNCGSLFIFSSINNKIIISNSKIYSRCIKLKFEMMKELYTI